MRRRNDTKYGCLLMGFLIAVLLDPPPPVASPPAVYTRRQSFIIMLARERVSKDSLALSLFAHGYPMTGCKTGLVGSLRSDPLTLLGHPKVSVS